MYQKLNQIFKNNFLFLLSGMILFGIAGFLFWISLGRLVFPGTAALLCFIGYPAVIGGLFGGIFHLWKQTA